MSKLYFQKQNDLWFYDPQHDITLIDLAKLLQFFTQSAVVASTPYHHGFIWHEFLDGNPELWRHFTKEGDEK